MNAITVPVRGAGFAAYDVVVGPGLVGEAGARLRGLGFRRVFVVADP